jgi:hypothetical protein
MKLLLQFKRKLLEEIGKKNSWGKNDLAKLVHEVADNVLIEYQENNDFELGDK